MSTPITLQVSGRFSVYYFNGPISLRKGQEPETFDLSALTNNELVMLQRAINSGIVSPDETGLESLKSLVDSITVKNHSPTTVTPSISLTEGVKADVAKEETAPAVTTKAKGISKSEQPAPAKPTPAAPVNTEKLPQINA